MKLVNDTIERFKKQKLINEKVAEGLKRNDPKTAKFYLRPKIHKEGNPGRPVVSSVNCHTANISKYVDYHLQPIVKEIPSYVKDTQDFLKKLEKVKDIPLESLLVTLVVKSLYTNIPNNEGIKAVKGSYEKYKEKTVSTKVIITFLSFILTLNNFVFNCTHYLQTMGCAMGTICAPSYANIFMANFEAKHIYPYIKEKSLLYLRYIDDIFMIWKGTKVETTLYRKPTDQQAFLFAKSEHPRSLKNSIPYSQALRLKTICSKSTEFDKNCAIIKQKFLDRQYIEEVLDEQIKKVDRIERKELFTCKEKNSKNRIPRSITYNRTLPNISKIVNRNWNILQINTEFHGVFQATLMIAFKRSRNLQEIIGGHTVKQGKVFKKNLAGINGKSVPCSSTRPSLCCTQVLNTQTFMSQKTKRTFNIFHKLPCKSQYVIYLMECILCKIQYVGKSETPFNLRLNNHRKDVYNPKAIPACNHFKIHGHKFMKHAKFTPIEQLAEISNVSKDTLRLRLKRREDFWIIKLETLAPKGLNQELNNV